MVDFKKLKYHLVSRETVVPIPITGVLLLEIVDEAITMGAEIVELKAALILIMRAAEKYKQHPDHPAAILNEPLASIAAIAAQGLGITRGPEMESVATSNKGHRFNDQDKCEKCGDRDWYAGPECAADSVHAPAQRITEQDAREFLNSFNKWFSRTDIGVPGLIEDFDTQVLTIYLRDEGRALLDKLNEHREPVQESQPLAPNDSDKSLSENSDLVKSIQDIWFKSGCAHLMNKTTAMNIIDAVVTANKAEVQEWRKHAAHWLQQKAIAQNERNKAHPEHVKCYPYWEQKVRELNWLAAELLMPLPPLKDSNQ